jgi:dipeptidase E
MRSSSRLETVASRSAKQLTSTVLLAKSIEPAKSIDNPDNAPDLKMYDGLGLIDFIPLPHVDREKYKDVFANFIQDYKEIIKIIRIKNDQALLTRNGSTYQMFDSAISNVGG